VATRPGPAIARVGYASSPVLYRDLCLLNFGPGERSFLIALEKKTGKTVWQYDLPAMSPEARWEDFGGDAKAGARSGAPKIGDIAGRGRRRLLVRSGGRDELVVALALQVLAVAPQTGSGFGIAAVQILARTARRFSGTEWLA